MHVFMKTESLVILFSKGVYKQVPIYERGGFVYAQHGTGFIQLRANSRTSFPGIAWVEHDLGDLVAPDRLSKLAYAYIPETLTTTVAPLVRRIA